MYNIDRHKFSVWDTISWGGKMFEMSEVLFYLKNVAFNEIFNELSDFFFWKIIDPFFFITQECSAW